jgi:hypothetical protein
VARHAARDLGNNSKRRAHLMFLFGHLTNAQRNLKLEHSLRASNR